MNVGFYQSVGAMRSLAAQQELIAANLSRQGVSGHRSAIAAVQTAAPDRPSTPGQGQAVGKTIQAAPHRLVTANDFAQGGLERTDNRLHLAIEGPAFFSVRGPDGQLAYTRNGAFTRRADGALSTIEGAALLDESGQPISLAGSGELVVAADGAISIGGEPVGRVGLAAFANPSAELQELRPGLFTPRAGAAPEPGLAGSRVAQGYLERSNTQPVAQMVAMVSVIRAYEANQKAISAQDEATGRLLRSVTALA